MRIPSVPAAEFSLRLLPGRSGESQSASYAFRAFDLAQSASRLSVTIGYEADFSVQLPVAIFDPSGSVRLMKAPEPCSGATLLTYTIGEGEVSKGGLSGPIDRGTWKLVLHKRILPAELDLRVCIEIGGDADSRAAARAEIGFDRAVPDPRPGWYCGELHLHSSESTGRTSVEVIRDVARSQALDFLAPSDHFTISHWDRIQELDSLDEKPLFLRSMEISGDRGHANVHGATGYIDPFVDDRDGALASFLGHRGTPGSMEAAADAIHAQGGLFCVNHPLSGGVAWRYADFPMAKADLLEVVSLPDGAVSALYTTLWDRFLCAGQRLVGVGSSDSHDPGQAGPWALGVIRNWVFAASLSRPALLDGLKRGRVYVSVGDSRLRFTVPGGGADGDDAGMGETVLITKGGSRLIRIELANHPSGNLFIVKDGFIHECVYLQGGYGPDILEFRIGETDIAGRGESFVRLEFHEDLVKSSYSGMAYRDHRSLRLLSNPVWFRATE